MFDNLELQKKSFHGLISEVLDCTNILGSDPANLAHHMVYFGASVGCSPFVEWRGSQIRANLNGIIVGPTGCGKGESLNTIANLYAFPKSKNDLVAPVYNGSLTSGKDMLDMIYQKSKNSEDENRLLAIDQECSNQLSCSNIGTNTLAGSMIKLFDGAKVETTIRNKSVIIEPTHFGSIGHITPSAIKRTLKEKDMQNGFANRLLFIGIPRPEYRYEEVSIPEQEIQEIQKQLIESIEIGGEREKIEIEASARDYFVDFNRKLDSDTSTNEKIDALRTRFKELTLKAALIFALTSRDEKISLQNMEDACSVMDYSSQTLKELYGAPLKETEEDIVKKCVEESKTISRTELMNTLAIKKIAREKANDIILKLLNKGILREYKGKGSLGRKPRYYELIQRVTQEV